MKSIEVAAAVIRRDDRIFATQRGYGDFKDWWEFPGGKVEAGETPREALAREIREELDTEVEVGEFIRTVEADYPEFHLTMHCFWCTPAAGTLQLKEHEAAAWLGCCDLMSVRWLPADLEIIPQIKGTFYQEVLTRCTGLVKGESDFIANAANVIAELHQAMGFLWTGIYRVIDGELVLGPFQGPVACTRIKYGKGVCGSAWASGEAILVPDVDLFPGHIRCSSLARSEVVVPIRREGSIIGVLDIDSDTVDGLDRTDLEYLCKIAEILSER